MTMMWKSGPEGDDAVHGQMSGSLADARRSHKIILLRRWEEITLAPIIKLVPRGDLT
jgi:hypothetical protein